MTWTVWKYELSPRDSQLLDMPKGARLLSVANQYEKPCLWALVDPSANGTKRRIAIVGTGHPAPNPDEDNFTFVGTIHLQGGGLILHVLDFGEHHQ